MDKLIGAIIMLGSTALYALLQVFLKKPSTQLPPFTVMAISMFVLFLVSFIASIFFENSLHLKASLVKSNLTILIIAGIINFFAFWLFILGFKFFPVWQQQLFIVLTPIFGGIFAYLLLGEAMNIKLFVGLAIVSLGLFIGLR